MQYVLNVAFTGKLIHFPSNLCFLPLTDHSPVPAIIYIDKWGRRPMLLVGTLLMGFWMFLVGGLQARFGEWSDASGTKVWVITGNLGATRAVIVCSYLFVCR